MISITLNTQAQRALADFSRQLADRSVPNRQLAVDMLGWVHKNFAADGALGEVKWAPLKPATIKAKLKKGYSPKPLQRTRNLYNSFLSFADQNQAGVGAAASFGVDYAAVHQKGAPSRNIPARPMLPPEKYVLDRATRIYGLRVETLLRKQGLK